MRTILYLPVCAAFALMGVSAVGASSMASPGGTAGPLISVSSIEWSAQNTKKSKPKQKKRAAPQKQQESPPPPSQMKDRPGYS